MNILMTANCFPPAMGGTEVYSYDLAISFSEQPDTSVKVLAPYSDGCEIWDRNCSLDITRYVSSLERVILFFRILLTQKIDKVYVTHRSHFLTLATLAHKFMGIPFWVTLHGTEYFGPDKAPQIARKLGKARRVVVTSCFVRDQAKMHGVKESLLSLIPPVVDTVRFNPEIESDLLRKKLNLMEERILVTVCRLVPQKQVDHVIKALTQIKSQLPPFHFFILGSGEEKEKLERLVQEEGLEKQITFSGAVPHHELSSSEGAYLNLADVFILTSQAESFGICYLEAGACGKPVIAYGSGGVLDIIDHEKTGLLIPPGDITGIGDALIKILTDYKFAQQMGNRARDRIVKNFDRRVVNKRVWHLLHLNEI